MTDRCRMTDQDWLEGMRQLVVAFPDRDLPEAIQETRGETYRRHLADLSAGQWRHAVMEAIRQERWFPPVATLREYAEGFMPVLALPAGECEACAGTGWETYERNGYGYVRPCMCRPMVEAKEAV